MRPVTIALTYPAADADSIVTSVTPAGGGALTLTNAAGVSFTNPTLITVTSIGDETGRTFTITGKDETGLHDLTVTLAGANAGAATTTRAFTRVTAVSVDAATADAITVGSAQAGHSAWIPLDIYRRDPATAISVAVSGTVNYDVEYANEDPFDPNVTKIPVAHPIAALTGGTANQIGQASIVMRAVRLAVNSGSGTATMTLVQQSVV